MIEKPQSIDEVRNNVPSVFNLFQTPYDKFYLEFHKLMKILVYNWFKFVELLLILGTLSYLKNEVGGLIIDTLYFVSFFIFFVYFFSLLTRLQNSGQPPSLTKRNIFISSVLLPMSMFLLVGLALFLNDIIVSFQKPEL